MAQRDEQPIIWMDGPRVTWSFIIILAIAVGATTLSVVLLRAKAGEIFLLACGGTLLLWLLTFQHWYDNNRQFLIYSDRLVVRHFWPWPKQVFAFRDITKFEVETHVNYGLTGNIRRRELRVYFGTDRKDSKLLDAYDPEGLHRLLVDLLERYRAAPPERGM